MTARALAAAAALALALALGAGPSLAEPARVLLIPPGAADPVTASLLDELVALGLIVEVEASPQRDLPALARARSARAALRVDPTRRAIEIWDAESPGVVRVEAQPGEPGGEVAGLALRAVELLRGRLIEVPSPRGALPTAGAPSAAVAPVAPPTPPQALAPGSSRAPRASGAAAAPDRRASIVLHVGPTIVLQPGSAISPEGAAMGGARWGLTDRLDGDILAVIPIVPATIDSPSGSARISNLVIAAGASMSLLDPQLPIVMRAGAGAGAGFLGYYGQGSTGDVRERDGTAPYALPFVRWDIGWHVHRILTLRAQALAGIAAPRPVLRLAGRSDVPFGRPLLAFSLQLDAGLQ